MAKLMYENLTYQLRGIFFRVYNELGSGLSETIYHRAIIKELDRLKIPSKAEKTVEIKFQDEKIGLQKLDLLVDNKVIIEIKSASNLHHAYKKQILSYLKATGLRVGLLVNFGTSPIQIRRYVN